MDEEIIKRISFLREKINDLITETVEDDIKDKTLKNHISKLKGILNETIEIVKKKQTFNESDFKLFVSVGGILSLNIEKVFHKEVAKNLEDKLNEKER